ncbi:hypothetical protein ACFVT9_38350 [Kitasatospora cineracea]|uniref:hypothetical protein n=1 Tax=Kitasatospora cineracea TaxID=88074 RepID=UPI0036D7958D
MDSTLSAENQLDLAVEFRVPIPKTQGGRYREVVVRRDSGSGAWAVTDGALIGLQAWILNEGWRPVWDIGRAAAFCHTREGALTLALQVAEIEAADHQALLAVAAEPLDRGVPTG